MTEFKKQLSYDPLTKTETIYGFEESTSGRRSDDKVVIQTKTDVTDIVKANKRQFNEVDKHHSWGQGLGTKVASIPLSLLHELRQKGIVQDQKKFKKWLNDPENRAFRTRGGKV
jgi:hypothetical protein